MRGERCLRLESDVGMPHPANRHGEMALLLDPQTLCHLSLFRPHGAVTVQVGDRMRARSRLWGLSIFHGPSPLEHPAPTTVAGICAHMSVRARRVLASPSQGRRTHNPRLRAPRLLLARFFFGAHMERRSARCGRSTREAPPAPGGTVRGRVPGHRQRKRLPSTTPSTIPQRIAGRGYDIIRVGARGAFRQ